MRSRHRGLGALKQRNMEWWVRCNSCGYYPSPLSSLPLLLTSCGHLVCGKCREGAPKSKDNPAGAVPFCLICKQPCKTVKVAPEPSEAGPDVMFYFSDEMALMKKIEQATIFQNMHYRMRLEADKRERLLAEIGEAQRQEKELRELEEKVKSSQIGILLLAVKEKWSKYLTPTEQATPNSHSRHRVCGSPMEAQIPNQTPRNTSSTLQPSTSMPLNKYSLLPGQGASLMACTSTPPVASRPQHHGIVTPTASGRSNYRGPSSYDHRIKANLMSQSQMQRWAQQSPAEGKTPTFAAGARSMHQFQSTPGSVGVRQILQHQTTPAARGTQLQQHPLNSVLVHNTPHVQSVTSIGMSRSYSGGNVGSMQARRNMAVGQQVHVPGSTLSQSIIQSMEF